MLIGYAITAAVYSSFILMLAFIFLERKGIKRILEESVNKYSLLALALILIFFILFSAFLVSPVEQLYFDKNIYQGIALNILYHGNALWCQFGTGYFQTCYANALYHDPVGWSAFLAIAFAIFGIGVTTAYSLELLVGALSILFFFLLTSVLFKRKSYAVVATLAFAVMPQLFIWSRTQADFDLPFMMVAILTFFLFILFTKRKNLNSLAMFAFSLDLVAYMRTEAILLIGVFAVLFFTFGDKKMKEVVKERIKQAKNVILSNTGALLLLLAFIVLLLPQIYYISLEAQNPSYGQSQGQAILSLTNFENNIGTNVQFLSGMMNGVNYYPMAFHYLITPLAIIGVLFLIFDKRIRNRFGILLLALLWFFTYFMFYTAFYAGSASFGVDSRFMLQLLPGLCLLAPFAIVGIGDGARWIASLVIKGRKNETAMKIIFGSAVALSCAALLVYPFVLLEPVVTLSPSAMPQQTVIYPSINYFYNNYNAVPQNCLVFTFTPDIWAEVNRSSAQIGYLNGANATEQQAIGQYKCLVIDYGYWCVVPPFHNTICNYAITHYQVKNLAVPQRQVSGNSTTFYQILNYT